MNAVWTSYLSPHIIIMFVGLIFMKYTFLQAINSGIIIADAFRSVVVQSLTI